MRIGLDARVLYAPHRRGIGKSLLRLYQQLALVRPHWRVVAYHRNPELVGEEILPAGFARDRLIEMPGDRFDAWQRLRLPMAAALDEVDLLHCPANTGPAWTPVPTVVTIHDLIPLDLPDTVAPAETRRFERGVSRACRHAAAITCPSIYTCRRLLRDLKLPPDRVHVTPWGAEPAPTFTDDELDAVATSHRVRRPFVLHFGAADPRKGTRTLLQAWAEVGEQMRRKWQLLVVGLDAETQTEFLDVAEDLGVGQSVVLHGFAREQDVPALLAAADVLAYPSRSEGFGLPMLEAFAAGTAVLAGSRTSLPEIAEGAALLVAPDDVAAVSRGLTNLLRDPELRREFVARGSKRLPHFSWRLCAERFARALESAAGAPSVAYTGAYAAA